MDEFIMKLLREKLVQTLMLLIDKMYEF